MTRVQIESIAKRAARLATREDPLSDYEFYYNEYLDQLLNNDLQCLRTWLGWEVENGVREAVDIMKRLIRAQMCIGGQAQ